MMSLPERPVAVAMSGGLDSSVAAWLLSRGDAPVVGLSMLLTEGVATPAGGGRCCGALDLGDARRVAAFCDIPHYTLEMRERFRETVIDPFVDDYLAGRTPVPCTRCNTWIKFDDLLDKATELGCETLATGHYARIVEGPGGPELHAAADPDKDQSYYLFELDAATLRRLAFPLGERSKAAVRRLAVEADLPVAGKGESMELCFVPGDIAEFVAENVAERPQRFPVAETGRPAEIVDLQGRTLGRGRPYYRYTVGQRRDLGVATGEKLYVIEIRPEANRVVVGPASALESAGLRGSGLHWVGAPPGTETRLSVRVRSRHAGVEATVVDLGEGRAEVRFEEPVRGVAPGQAAVFYEGSQVLGGCWIESSIPAEGSLSVDVAQSVGAVSR